MVWFFLIIISVKLKYYRIRKRVMPKSFLGKWLKVGIVYGITAAI